MTKQQCNECLLYSEGMCQHFEHAKDKVSKDRNGQTVIEMSVPIESIPHCDKKRTISL